MYTIFFKAIYGICVAYKLLSVPDCRRYNSLSLAKEPKHASFASLGQALRVCFGLSVGLGAYPWLFFSYTKDFQSVFGYIELDLHLTTCSKETSLTILTSFEASVSQKKG